ncbi:FtsK/SpoIIIE domain-containing protein [Streptomyces sp. NPDC051976]|uniref:FtsK/SpoIIIE domain-containing protein n=1 Tax=Streptomyces sp. NPDC051976 TaxID=3154947 RepID=UPI00342AF904
MQIRLTVLGPRSGRAARACDVLITAPAGTALGAVAGALASAAGSGQPARSASSSVALFAGAQRLAPTAVLGVPPLVDGALLSLHAPAGQPGDHGQYGQFGQYGRPTAESARLHVIGGPDAGGVHLLQGGQARIGRSADADVPLDDPDVSRLHCEIAVGADGRVTVADLGSTNGTTLSGRPVGAHPLPLLPGALLRIGESTLRLEAAGSAAPAALAAVADSDGHLRVSLRDAPWPSTPPPPTEDPSTAATHGAGFSVPADVAGRPGRQATSGTDHTASRPGGAEGFPGGRTGGDAHGAASRPGPEGFPGRTGQDADRAAARPGGHDGGTAPGAPGSGGRDSGFPGGAPAQRPTRPPIPAQSAAPAQDRPPAAPGSPAGHGGTGSGQGGADTDWELRGLGQVPGDGAEAFQDASGRSHTRRATPGQSGGGRGPHPEDQGDPADQPDRHAPDSGRRATGERRGRVVVAGGAEQDRGGEGRGVVGSIGAWARRRLAGGKSTVEGGEGVGAGEADALRERWPDAAAVLLTVLGPGRRLWERGAGHPDALTVRLGTADLPSEDGTRRLSGVPFTVDLRGPRTAALTLAGPRPRLAGLARAVLAQLCALHSPATLEVVLVSADRARTADQRAEEWSWLNWLPHLRPAHGQDCRLLLAFDRDQAEARTAEIVRRLEAGPLGAGWAGAAPAAVSEAAAAHEGPFTLLVVDGDPGSATLRETAARIAAAGPSVGVHVLCLAEQGERPAVGSGIVARLSGDVATTLHIEPAGIAGAAAQPSLAPDEIVLDAVSAAWAEHFARALAPLREADAEASGARSRHALPGAVRLLDELDLALATPAKIGARWAAAPTAVGTATAVLGVGSGGRVAVDLLAEGPHALVGGAPGAGKTELLRSVAAALAAGERPDRLSLVLVDGAGQERGEGLRACADLPHVSTHLVASDPVRMREFAQALGGELKRRAEILDGQDFAAWHADRLVAATVPHQSGRGGRTATGRNADPQAAAAQVPGQADAQAAAVPPQGTARAQVPARPDARAATHEAPQGAARPEAPGQAIAQAQGAPQPALPRLVVVVDDFDALVAPGLGSTGRPAAGSVVRALEAVARDGGPLGVHLVASTGRPERTAGTEADQRSRLRIALRMPDPESAALLVHVEDPAGLDDSVPGRGYLRRPGGGVTPFQAGRVSGRIPRTATLRPTVVPLEWERMGDPPARRQVRELGNGPTDLALLASALQRAAESAPEQAAAQSAGQGAGHSDRAADDTSGDASDHDPGRSPGGGPVPGKSASGASAAPLI